MVEQSAREIGASRREFLFASAAAIVASGIRFAPAAEPAQASRTAVGFASNVWDIHQRAAVRRGQKGDQSDPLAFLAQCERFGAAGMQLPLGIRDDDYTAKLRKVAEDKGMYIEGSIDLAGNRLDLDRFEKQLLTAKSSGADVVRVVVTPGRRYEEFKSAEQFRASREKALKTLQAVEPIAAKHRMPLAVENHKDHRINERLELLKKIGSEYVGVCVDVGNSFSLCEDPTEVVRAYAPYAMSVHLKDQAVREYNEGFLFADAALGKGFLELAEMIRLLRQARPKVRFNLEVMTRDPLRVPVLTAGYWATMGDVPASDLAHTLRTVKEKSAVEPLMSISGLSIDQQVDVETENIKLSLDFARNTLKI